MTTKTTSTEKLSPRALKALADVEACALSAAESAKDFLKSADENAYIRFLDAMYHYTIDSGQKCATAAKHVEPKDVKDLLIEFDDHEGMHYKLAVKDLEAFGLTTSEEKPDSIKAIDDFCASMEGRHHNGYLAMVYVFENIAKHVQKEVRQLVNRLSLSTRESRWLRCHAEADLEHGAILMGILKNHIEENPTIAVAAAKQANALWSTMMLDIIDNGYRKLPEAA